jgi:NAD(P)-dependent dehydrogenase (short-subunit alcohol dehydrogenase family)
VGHLQLDVASAASRAAAPQRLRELGLPALHALVNNAGVYVDGWSQDAFNANVSVNFTGRLASPRCIDRCFASQPR